MPTKFKINDDVEIKNTIFEDLNGNMAKVISVHESDSEDFNLYKVKFYHDDRIFFICAEQFLFDIDFYELYGFSKFSP